MADIKIEDHGTIVMLQPLTDEGHSWLADNCAIEPWQRWGGAVAVDHRMAATIVEGMRADGLTLA